MTSLLRSLAACSLCVSLAGPLSAAITASGGAVSVIPAPPTCMPHTLESAVTIYAWDEQQGVGIPGPLAVNIDGTPGVYSNPASLTGGALAPGVYDSHILHIDAPVGFVRLGGMLQFDGEIVGVMLLCDELNFSDGPFGWPATMYPACPPHMARGCDWWPGGPPEVIDIQPDRRTMFVDLNSSNMLDHVRVITRRDVSACVGDIDGDGDTDQGDLGELLAAYGSCQGDDNWNAAADLDNDGCVAQSDLGVLLSDYGCMP
jgi:hypothetical protein